MVKVLIPTKPDDNDALYVKLALEKRGHECVVWYTADFPQKQTHSFELFQNKIYWSARGVDFRVNPDDHFGVVWYRRPRQPCLPDAIHPDDIPNARNENLALFKTFWHVLAPNAFWINPVDASNKASCKLLQLRVAMEVGLNIPDTLFSNDPGQIKVFIDRYNNENVIYKTLHPLIWINQEEMRLTYTNEIKIENLPSDTILQYTPGIFQNKVAKQFELRVTYFGEHYVAVKIDSQQDQRSKMDWRNVPGHQLQLSEFQLPDEIDAKCKALMRKMGLVMGCFDMIVTPDNEYYFLEVNEQGQFLWVEEYLPDVRMLDMFCNFIINGSMSYGKASPKPVRMTDLRSHIYDLKKDVMDKHVKPADRY